MKCGQFCAVIDGVAKLQLSFPGRRIGRRARAEQRDCRGGDGKNASGVVHIVRAIVAAMNRLHNKTALITGGNSGIGLATARLFLAEGAQVAITGRNRETLAAAAKELGPEALIIEADATHPGAPDEAVARTMERFGKLDIVFANAGIVGQTPLGSTTAEAFERILNVNLTAGNPNMSAYAASKGGVRAMTRVLAAELAPRGIRVNIVIPGPTRTPIRSSRVASPEALAALEANIMRSIPLNDLGEVDDIAYAVLYLASDEARHVTAAEIVVDGGCVRNARRGTDLPPLERGPSASAAALRRRIISVRPSSSLTLMRLSAEQTRPRWKLRVICVFTFRPLGVTRIKRARRSAGPTKRSMQPAFSSRSRVPERLPMLHPRERARAPTVL